jgi:hypothetical protein
VRVLPKTFLKSLKEKEMCVIWVTTAFTHFLINWVYSGKIQVTSVSIL